MVNNIKIPQKAYNTLNIKSSNPNVTYKEYDVNPTYFGQDRGGERLVLGSDGSVYYTDDHYASFTKIR